MKHSSYNQAPTVHIQGWDSSVWTGYASLGAELKQRLLAAGKGKGQDRNKRVLVIECYPGVRENEILDGLTPVLKPSKVIRAADAVMSPDDLNRLIGRYMTDDRVFGHLAPFAIDELLVPEKLRKLQEEVRTASEAGAGAEAVEGGPVVVIGFGASLLAEGDVLVYADLARWEIQLRMRAKEIGNWQADNREEDMLRKYKRGYFFEWRVADRLKRTLMDRMDYYLDTNKKDDPRLVTGEALLDGLRQTAERPFRLVPYFDPGVWGGTWLQEHIGLPEREHPYAWGFDGVPEENSLYFLYGNTRVELPSINLVFHRPVELLGEKVFSRFGAEFPIRFDFLDTISGQHLSLQVHPTTDYIRQAFGMSYTQDESYYILEAKPGAMVYLGLKDGVDREAMIRDLERAQAGEISFPAEQYVNVFPAEKHDHFLIPAGTIHCSGSECMVLEISATPYIFTFKLWDWDRLGLDGKPRPVHLDHGKSNIQWNRTTEWVQSNLVNPIEPVGEGEGWREEKTGLHGLEFIETRRHWFTDTVEHETGGSVNMLNLVEGEEAVVESPTDAFEPFIVRYAETFIIPAEVGRYRIRPHGPSVGSEIGTIKAYVRA